ncbi:MAG: DUF4118 domain-containing protein [Anaerolineae bacterium]|nr:DUF4118 domain-containing protein [Anaerolineae bacterium]
MSRLHTIKIYLFSLLGVAVITLCAWFLRDTLTLANFILFYLLFVVIIAIYGGIGPAYVAIFASFMGIDYFLVPPYETLWIADPRELFDLIVFFIVASIAGRLAANARRQTQEAQQRAHEIGILYRLTRLFNTTVDNQGVYEALTNVLREDMSVQQVQIFPYASDNAAADSNTIYYMMLQSGETIYGTVRIAFDDPLVQPQPELLQACVSQAAMALERIDLAERANKSRQFEEADKLKTVILHAVSHDLRTPITIIKTSASNLHQFHDQLTHTETAEIIETIEHEIDHLDKLVGNLLDMSRLRAGMLQLNCQLNELEEVAGDVAARVWQMSKQERVKIIFADNMPLVSFDYGLMLQAVSNLVDNSLRYEPPDSQIEICGSTQGSQACLKIVNHGATIEPDIKILMMEPFYHGHKGHIGLGLPIARGIIEAHQGRLTVEDTPGGGATFVIDLPLNEEKET